MDSNIAIDPALLPPPTPITTTSGQPSSTSLPSAPLPQPHLQSRDPQNQDDSDSEWEYDWDDPDVYYLTLDLTIPTPLFPHVTSSASQVAKSSAGGSSTKKQDKGKSSTQKSTKQKSVSTPTASNPTNATTTAPSTSKSTIHPRPLTATSSSSFQLQGFDTKNPLISYQNRIYSCEWTEIIGTELFVDTSTREIIGVGRERLHGNPSIVTAKGRNADFRGMRAAVAANEEGAKGQLGMSGKDAVGVKTEFWRRLEEIKLRRGEMGEKPGGSGVGGDKDRKTTESQASAGDGGTGEKGRGREMLELEGDFEEEEDDEDEEEEDVMEVDDNDTRQRREDGGDIVMTGMESTLHTRDNVPPGTRTA